VASESLPLRSFGSRPKLRRSCINDASESSASSASNTAGDKEIALDDEGMCFRLRSTEEKTQMQMENKNITAIGAAKRNLMAAMGAGRTSFNRRERSKRRF
jgi:hypothetical protein